jgi:hypothetical protein
LTVRRLNEERGESEGYSVGVMRRAVWRAGERVLIEREAKGVREAGLMVESRIAVATPLLTFLTLSMVAVLSFELA